MLVKTLIFSSDSSSNGGSNFDHSTLFNTNITSPTNSPPDHDMNLFTNIDNNNLLEIMVRQYFILVTEVFN